MPGSDTGLAFRLFSSLLTLYPAGFRSEYGHSMEMHFRDLCRESERRHPQRTALAVLLGLLPDLVISAGREHYEGVIAQGASRMTPRDGARIAFIVGMPIALAIGGAVVNPSYMAQLIIPSDAQPVGWLLMASFFCLTSLALVAQWKIALVAESAKPLPRTDTCSVAARTTGATLARHRALGRRGRGLLFTLAVVLTTLPATLIVLVGPAVVTLLRAGLLP